MKAIDEIYVVHDSDMKRFLENLKNKIQEYQDKGLEVEVQYTVWNGIVLSAMVLGRIVF